MHFTVFDKNMSNKGLQTRKGSKASMAANHKTTTTIMHASNKGTMPTQVAVPLQQNCQQLYCGLARHNCKPTHRKCNGLLTHATDILDFAPSGEMDHDDDHVRQPS